MPLSLSNSEALGRSLCRRSDDGRARSGWARKRSRLVRRDDLERRTRTRLRRETLRVIRRALSRAGVLVSFSKNNGLASVSISFATDEGEEEE